jgi:hypothetical protein
VGYKMGERLLDPSYFALSDILDLNVEPISKVAVETTDTGYLIEIDTKCEYYDEGEILKRMTNAFELMCYPLDKYRIVYEVH